jgi:hypothetical protein
LVGLLRGRLQPLSSSGAWLQWLDATPVGIVFRGVAGITYKAS